MTDGRVIVPPDSSGKSIDTTEVVRSSDQTIVERQRINVADPTDTTSTGLASVSSSELSVADSDIRDTLSEILFVLHAILEEIRH
jgi:hypothetical protein